MLDRHWYRPLFRLLLPFLATVVVLSAGLVWLGWRTIAQDRALAQQRVRDRLESSADLVATQLRQTLAELEEPLSRLSIVGAAGLDDAASEYAAGLGDDALVVAFGDGVVQAYPIGRLPYHPGAEAGRGAPAELFAAGEAREFGAGDLIGAMAHFERLARSDDTEVRAGALLRLARSQRKADLADAALTTYAALADMGPVPVAGRPADLVARHARCRLLADAGRNDELAVELRELAADLHAGHWKIDRAVWLYFFEETQKLLDAHAPRRARDVTPPSLSLAAGAELARDLWQTEAPEAAVLSGRRQVTVDGRALLVAWRGSGERVVVLGIGPEFMERRIIGSLRPLLELQSVGVVLADREGQPIYADAVTSSEQTTVRTVADTGLPWTLRLVAIDQVVPAEGVTPRARLAAVGLALLVLSVMAGTYFSGRAASREIEAARLQSDFVAAVSHEFRTPLTSLRQFTDLLSDGRVSSDDDRAESYAALQRGTRRLSRLVENLLDFGRFEAGSRAFDLQAMPARTLVEETVVEFQEEVGSDGHRVEMTWHGGDGLVQADAPALGRVLWNLLDNAVKYSPGGSAIRVEGRVGDSEIEIGVRDQGVGVPDTDRRRIFEKFVRGSDTAGSRVKGTGLGLALVRQIVDAHGGRVTLESEVGHGSTFSVILPLAE
jgi:signal transduction histidine kinase